MASKDDACESAGTASTATIARPLIFRMALSPASLVEYGLDARRQSTIRLLIPDRRERSAIVPEPAVSVMQHSDVPASANFGTTMSDEVDQRMVTRRMLLKASFAMS